MDSPRSNFDLRFNFVRPSPVKYLVCIRQCYSSDNGDDGNKNKSDCCVDHVDFSFLSIVFVVIPSDVRGGNDENVY